MSGILVDQAASNSRDRRPRVLRKLEKTMEELRRVEHWLAWASVALAVAGLGTLFLLADWIWVLPRAARALDLPAMAALAVFVYLRSRRQAGQAQVAAALEDQFPELGQRVRTVVEYAAPPADLVPASRGILKALGRDTDRRTAKLDFRRLVPWAALERRAVGVFFVAMAGIVMLVVSPGFRTALLRLFLVPAHYTTMRVAPGDVTLKAGEPLELEVVLAGRPVSTARWMYRQKGQEKWLSAPLGPDSAPGERPVERLAGTLKADLADCQTDLDYRVVAGELESRKYHVKVVHPLHLTGLEATITPPSYTRKPAEVVTEGSFQAIEGSAVELAITLDHAPKTAALALGARDDSARQTLPLQIDGSRLSGSLPALARDLTYEITAVDDEGMTLEIEPFRVTVLADQKPTVKLIRPEELLAVTPTTEVPIQVEAGDDFGVARVGISFKIGDGPAQELLLANHKDQPVTAQALTTIYLEKHSLNYTDGIAYFAFVEDNYPSGPHRVVSEMRYIDILPYKQEHALVPGGGGTCNGSSTSLGELIARQRTNLSRTFAFENDQPVADETARRLSKYEDELAAATNELSDGIAALAGPIPALNEAVAAMRSASQLLTAKDLQSARPREEAALKSLLSARQNFRKMLKLTNSQQASQCRTFDRQQFQKIRRPPALESKKQLAKLEGDIKKLAAAQRKFSEEIEPQGRGGAQLEPPKKDQQAAPKQAQSSKPSAQRGSKPSSSGSSSATAGQSTPQESTPAQNAQRAAEEAERLRQLAKSDQALTEHTNRRLDQAAQAVQESSKAMQAGRTPEAAQAAKDAAAKLESVARQVGALQSRELADRIARLRDMAQAIAQAEHAMAQALQKEANSTGKDANAQKRLADRQRELADETAALNDVMKQLKMAAAEESSELAHAIDRAAQANPPDAVEASVRKSAQAIGAGEIAAAARDAAAAADRLAALAAHLQSIRREAIAPQLERLIAAEKEAAQLQERLRSVKTSGQRAEAEKSLSELAARLENLAPADGALKEAIDKLTAAARSTNAGWMRKSGAQAGEQGPMVPPVDYSQSLGAAILALQTRIQEIMIDNALVERTGPVPPRYKELVEDYYRVLSQDLR